MHGVIVVNKPTGWTSHDAVAKVRRLANTKKVGHLGTLDPMATGVLPLVVGGATRMARFYTGADKIYQAVIRFGFATDSYDRDGTPTTAVTAPTITPGALEPLLAAFRGAIQQLPPQVSAKKVAGVPAYKMARKNIAVELKPVQVTVYSLELLRCEGAEAEVRVHCSAGTYLRSIAHDLGTALGCGAHLSQLERTAVNDFTLDQARSIPELEELAKEGRIAEVLIPAAKLLPQFPAETVDALTAGQIRQGRDFRVSPFRVQRGTKYVKAVSPEGDLIAIGEAKLPNVYHPILVL